MSSARTVKQLDRDMQLARAAMSLRVDLPPDGNGFWVGPKDGFVVMVAQVGATRCATELTAGLLLRMTRLLVTTRIKSLFRRR